MKRQAILTIGIPASGKTTWANQFIKENPLFENVNRDDLRAYYLWGHEGITPFSWSKWKSRYEEPVNRLWKERIEEIANDNLSVVISDTNLNKKYRDRNIDYLTSLGFHTQTKLFPISFEAAVKRDILRPNPVGSFVIAKYWKQYHEQFTESWISLNKTLPECVIFDLDGTLASHEGVRGVFDFTRVARDHLIDHTARLVKYYHRDDVKIIFLTGREEVARIDTQKWISKHFPFLNDNESTLLMRRVGDFRPDTEIKEELFVGNILNKYHVVAIFEDRPKVVRMWQSRKLPVFALGNQHQDF